MGASRLTANQRRKICKSPAVEKVENDRIYLDPYFRAHLVACVRQGDSPSKVFARAGLPSSLIGSKRIERATAHAMRSERVKDLLDNEGDVWEESEDDDDDLMRVILAMSARMNGLERRLSLACDEIESLHGLLEVETKGGDR